MLLNHTLQSVSIVENKNFNLRSFCIVVAQYVYYSIYFSTQIRMMYSKGAGRF